MAFQKAVKGTILAGGGALATVLGLSHFAHYKRKQGLAGNWCDNVGFFFTPAVWLM